MCYLHLAPGYALGGTSEPENQLAAFIQQAKDQVCRLEMDGIQTQHVSNREDC